MNVYWNILIKVHLLGKIDSNIIQPVYYINKYHLYNKMQPHDIESNIHSMTTRSRVKIIPTNTPLQTISCEDMESGFAGKKPAPKKRISSPYTEILHDFDEASVCWQDNKRKKTNGCYEYLCDFMLSIGRKCTKTVCKESLEDYCSDIRTCKTHYRKGVDYII